MSEIRVSGWQGKGWRNKKGQWSKAPGVCEWANGLCVNPYLWWLEQFICVRPYQPRCRTH